MTIQTRFAILTLLLITGCARPHHRQSDAKYYPPVTVPGNNGHSIVFTTLPSSSCVYGGTSFIAATDLNDNGMVDLGDAMLTSSEICNGNPGTSGSNGHNIVVETAASISCTAGGTTVILATDYDDSNTVSTGDAIKSFDICSGVAGADGTPGLSAPPTAYTPVELIDPCGDAPGKYDEVLLRLNNNTILASFSDNASGLNTRWSIIPAGSYSTTDGTNCNFNVSAVGVVTW